MTKHAENDELRMWESTAKHDLKTPLNHYEHESHILRPPTLDVDIETVLTCQAHDTNRVKIEGTGELRVPLVPLKGFRV